ncbi:S24/S26 family peptidase [Streptomyces sp. NPDC001985]|uniref:S24/S26 family peptidase n=1 Tax=Streptomyces sp. NPDC001985 TaxID=3154406 RepID=UPI00331AA8DE
MRAVWAGAGVGVLAGVVWWVRRRCVAITVDGESMSPALRPGSRVLIRRGTAGLRRGRIAVLASPDPDPATAWRGKGPVSGELGAVEWCIKRVVAVEGDRMPRGVAGGGGRVPVGHVVVIGDYPLSQDSKQYGPCPVHQILGLMILPLRPRPPRVPGNLSPSGV